MDIAVGVLGPNSAICCDVYRRPTAVRRRVCGGQGVAVHVNAAIEVQAVFRGHECLDVEEFVRLKCNLTARAAGLDNAADNDFLIGPQGQRLVVTKADDLTSNKQAISSRVKIAVFIIAGQIMVRCRIRDTGEIGRFVEDIVARVVVGVIAAIRQFARGKDCAVVLLFLRRDHQIARGRDRTTQQHRALGFQINLAVHTRKTQTVGQHARGHLNHRAVGGHLDVYCDSFLDAVFRGEGIAVGDRVTVRQTRDRGIIQRELPAAFKAAELAVAARANQIGQIGINGGVLDAHAHRRARVNGQHVLRHHAHGGIVALGEHARELDKDQRAISRHVDGRAIAFDLDLASVFNRRLRVNVDVRAIRRSGHQCGRVNPQT